MYININGNIARIDQVYSSNVNLNELLSTISKIQDNMYEYLNTKSSDALGNYYREGQQYRKLIEELNVDITDNEMILTQKNIKSMSETYLEMTEETVQAKRGRNIEKYKVNYEEASTMFEYINTYIYSLNNELFKNNSNNYELLLVSLKYLEIISSVVLVVISILNVLILIILTRRITGPLMKLARAANEVASGNLQVDLIPVDTEDEVGIVSKAFNKMIVNLHEYIMKTKESLELESKMKERELMMASHLKDAQLKYLQAQINPHFLFNTLNAGAQLAMMEGAEKTCLFVENMADFFRYNVKSINQDSNIREEIKLVDSYIYILNVRFSGEIHFIKEVEEELLEVSVPSMILQPIIENAVNYGIRNIDREGYIKLSIFGKDQEIYISIKDNGAGMDEDIIENILSGKRKESNITKDSSGIGLGNVIKRLQLYYERQDVIEIKSEGENLGTEVMIKIPKYYNKSVKQE